MPPALQNPFVLWFVLTAALAGLAYSVVRQELRVRAIALRRRSCSPAWWRSGRPTSATASRARSTSGLDLRAGSTWCCRWSTDDALNATIDDAVQHRARPGDAQGHRVRRRPARRRHLLLASRASSRRASRTCATSCATSSATAGRCASRARARFLVQDDRPLRSASSRTSTVQEAIKTLERRVNQLGRRRAGDRRSTATSGDQILVQLPGVTDVEQAKRVIKTTAQLSLKLVEDSAASREALLAGHRRQGARQHGGRRRARATRRAQPVFYLVRREAVITGRDLKNARVGVGREQRARRAVHAEPAGRRQVQARDRRATSAAGWRSSSTARVDSAPVIQGQIGDRGPDHRPLHRRRRPTSWPRCCAPARCPPRSSTCRS